MKINASSNDVQGNEIVVSSLQFVLPQNSPHPRLNTVIIIQEQTNNQRKKKSKTANTKQLAELIVAYRMSQSPDTKALYRASMTSYDIGQPVLDLL